MLVGGIAAAKRSLGEKHFGVLMGEGELGRPSRTTRQIAPSLRTSDPAFGKIARFGAPGHCLRIVQVGPALSNTQ